MNEIQLIFALPMPTTFQAVESSRPAPSGSAPCSRCRCSLWTPPLSSLVKTRIDIRSGSPQETSAFGGPQSLPGGVHERAQRALAAGQVLAEQPVVVEGGRHHVRVALVQRARLVRVDEVGRRVVDHAVGELVATDVLPRPAEAKLDVLAARRVHAIVDARRLRPRAGRCRRRRPTSRRRSGSRRAGRWRGCRSRRRRTRRRSSTPGPARRRCRRSRSCSGSGRSSCPSSGRSARRRAGGRDRSWPRTRGRRRAPRPGRPRSRARAAAAAPSRRRAGRTTRPRDGSPVSPKVRGSSTKSFGWPSAAAPIAPSWRRAESIASLPVCTGRVSSCTAGSTFDDTKRTRDDGPPAAFGVMPTRSRAPKTGMPRIFCTKVVTSSPPGLPSLRASSSVRSGSSSVKRRA